MGLKLITTVSTSFGGLAQVLTSSNDLGTDSAE